MYIPRDPPLVLHVADLLTDSILIEAMIKVAPTPYQHTTSKVCGCEVWFDNDHIKYYWNLMDIQ